MELYELKQFCDRLSEHLSYGCTPEMATMHDKLREAVKLIREAVRDAQKQGFDGL